MLVSVVLAFFVLEQYTQRAWLIDHQWYSLEETADTVTFRCQSFRPVSFSKKKEKGTIRILFMGGSPIFGFPHRPVGTEPILSADEHGIVGSLQQLLNQNTDQKYELINLGVNGGRSSDTRTLFRKAQAWT